MNIVFGIIGFIGICLCILKKSVIGGLIISCICFSVLTFLNTPSYINFVEEHVGVEQKQDTVIVHDTIFQDPLVYRDDIDTTFPGETCEVDSNGVCVDEIEECGCDDEDDEETVESDTVETPVDTVITEANESEIDTIIIYPNPGITQEELDRFVETVEEVIDSLESVEIDNVEIRTENI